MFISGTIFVVFDLTENKFHVSNPYLVLLLQHLWWMILFIRDINTLQTMNVSGQTSFVDMSLSSFDSFNNSIMDEDVLFFGLN